MRPQTIWVFNAVSNAIRRLISGLTGFFKHRPARWRLRPPQPVHQGAATTLPLLSLDQPKSTWLNGAQRRATRHQFKPTTSAATPLNLSAPANTPSIAARAEIEPPHREASGNAFKGWSSLSRWASASDTRGLVRPCSFCARYAPLPLSGCGSGAAGLWTPPNRAELLPKGRSRCFGGYPKALSMRPPGV